METNKSENPNRESKANWKLSPHLGEDKIIIEACGRTRDCERGDMDQTFWVLDQLGSHDTCFEF